MARLPSDEDKAVLTKLLNECYKYSLAINNHVQEHAFPAESLIMSLLLIQPKLTNHLLTGEVGPLGPPGPCSSTDLIHVVWQDNIPPDIFNKRDGADFDPTTVNLSNNPVSSHNSAIAVSGKKSNV